MLFAGASNVRMRRISSQHDSFARFVVSKYLILLLAPSALAMIEHTFARAYTEIGACVHRNRGVCAQKSRHVCTEFEACVHRNRGVRGNTRSGILSA